MNIPSAYSLQQFVRQAKPQENVSCCTASATLHAAELSMKSIGINRDFSRLYLYYMTRKLQGRLGYPGAELKSTLEAFTKYGVCDEDLWQFTKGNIEREPTREAIEAGVHNKLLSYSSIPADNFKSNILNNTPVVIGFRTGKLFWKLSGKLHQQLYKPINSTDNRNSTGHAAVIVGYDDDICGGSWIVLNSLGPRWGDKGFGILPYTCNVDIGEAYVMTGLSGIPRDKNFL